VIAVAGDGDAFSIGGNHLLHTARRNIDLTYIIMDNGIYGMTKGQSSPTTGANQKTKTTPYGILEEQINPVKIALCYGVSFIARTFSGNKKQIVDIIVEGIKHPGFSFIQVLSPCVTFMGNEQYEIIRSLAIDLGEDYDETSIDSAWKISNQEGNIPMGIIYRVKKTVYCERIHEAEKIAGRSENKNFDPFIERYVVAS
jgi:2-oxoglutarate ferredoxin oxidoreductase subunit beta